MERQAHNSLNEAALQVQLGEAKKKKQPVSGFSQRRAKEEMDKSLFARKGDKLYKGPWQKRDASAFDVEGRERDARKMAQRNDHVEYDEVDSMVLEYFDNYFGDNLNEDTSDEDIMQAVHDLIDLAEAVCDAVGLDEKIIKPFSKVVRHPGKRAGATIERTPNTWEDPSSRGFGKRAKSVPSTFVPPKYADSKTKIRTLKIPAGAKIKKPQISPKIDASQLPVVGPGQPDYHQM